MTLHELVDKHGIAKVAQTLGMKEQYIERCYRYPTRFRVKAVKLVNAANKLKAK